MPTHKSKKSESLEIRISYDVKKALYEKAETENRSVSSIIRSMIDDYLTAEDIGSVSQKRYIQMFIEKLLVKPKMVLASLFAVSIFGLTAIPVANAEPILLNVEGEISKINPNNPDLISTRKIETTLLIEDGGTVELNLPPNQGQALFDDLIIRLTLEETIAHNGKKGVSIQMFLSEQDGDMETTLAEPKLTVPLGEQAEFVTGNEGGDTIEFKFVPQLKQ